MSATALNRRDFLKSAAILSAATAFQPQVLAGNDKPNIVLIMADDLGYECLGANGGTSYKTPVLDQLAKTGTRFEHCYAQPLCTPSRVQLMTGMYNCRNYVKFGVMDREQTTFAHLLKKNGYATCVAGKWQLGNERDSAQHFGFDQSCLWHHTQTESRYARPRLDINGKSKKYKDGSYGPDVTTDFICDFMERKRENPFLVYYPMILPHCPFEPTPDSPDWDPKAGQSKTYKGDKKYFADMVAYMDKNIGEIIAKLETLGLRENTLILFVADNGTDEPVVSRMNDREVAGAKGRTTDGGTRVPFIANWPAVVPGGRVSADLVDFSDFLPTLCETAGAAIPSKLTIDGHSLLSQLKGEKGNPRAWVYSWYHGKAWARNQRYKLYETGHFYDIQNDVLEENPIITPSGEESQVGAMLEEALEKYKGVRPEKYKQGDGNGKAKKQGDGKDQAKKQGDQEK